MKRRTVLNSKRISTHYGIRWIAEPCKNSASIMKSVYRRRSRQDFFLGCLMEREFPLIKSDVLSEKERDIRIAKNNTFILATPLRPYSEWGHEFMKLDISVVGPLKKESAVIRRFEELKKESVKEKQNTPKYVKHVLPYLDKMAKEGLIIGILGRGSYFNKNGFPNPPPAHEDINFVLFTKDSSKDTQSKIIGIIKKIPKSSVIFVRGNEKYLKHGKSPAFSFVIVSKEDKPHRKIGLYEKYILEKGVRIDLPHLKRKKTEAVINKFITMIGPIRMPRMIPTTK